MYGVHPVLVGLTVAWCVTWTAYVALLHVVGWSPRPRAALYFQSLTILGMVGLAPTVGYWLTGTHLHPVAWVIMAVTLWKESYDRYTRKVAGD